MCPIQPSANLYASIAIPKYDSPEQVCELLIGVIIDLLKHDSQSNAMDQQVVVCVSADTLSNIAWLHDFKVN